MTIDVLSLGSNSVMISYSYTETPSALFSACNDWIVAHGWTLHDTVTANQDVIYKAICKNGSSYKYIRFIIDASGVKVRVYETWNATTHVGTNECSYPEAPTSVYQAISLNGGTSIGGVVYLFATNRYFAVNAKLSNNLYGTANGTYGNGVIGCFELSVDDSRASNASTNFLYINSKYLRAPLNMSKCFSQYPLTGAVSEDAGFAKMGYVLGNSAASILDLKVATELSAPFSHYNDAATHTPAGFIGLGQLAMPRTIEGYTGAGAKYLAAILPWVENRFPTRSVQACSSSIKYNLSGGFVFTGWKTKIHTKLYGNLLDVTQRVLSSMTNKSGGNTYWAFTPQVISFSESESLSVFKKEMCPNRGFNVTGGAGLYATASRSDYFLAETRMKVKDKLGRIYGLKVTDTAITYNPMDTCTLKVDSDMFPAATGTVTNHYMTPHGIMLPA